MLFAPHLIGKVQGRAFRNKNECQGRRMASLNEMLQSARFTKYYGLEDHYDKQMARYRQDELRALLRMKVCLGTIWPAAAVVSMFAALAVLLTYLLLPVACQAGVTRQLCWLLLVYCTSPLHSGATDSLPATWS